MLALRLRWALRDAKSRWVQVVGIAFMIAIGTGMFSGLSSVTQWRFASNDASLALTNMYDIRARPSGDGFLPQGSLAAIAEGIDGVEAVEERLITPTQVEVDTGGGSIFVRARVIGVDMSDGGPSVNGVELMTGRELEETEFGEPVVLIERNFGVFYELPDEGELRLGGDVAALYVGHAVSPEYFLIVEDGGFFGQANLAVIFTSIETAQELSGRQGQVNDLVLTVEPGTDLAAVETA
ncbi:MAG: ABC transporter permease, partial [Chloroflexi bacterium]|nr:ABC transporter permease [Chloroflexota bacterium]